MKRNKMTQKFSLSVSRFATAAVSVAVVLCTPQSGAAQVTSGAYFTGGYTGGIEVKLTQCDLARTKAQTAFVACITKAQAKGQAASGAYFMEECEINGPNGTGHFYLPVARRDEAACERTLTKAYDSAETRLAGCTTKIRTAQEFVDWAFGPVGPHGSHTGGALTPEIKCITDCPLEDPGCLPR